MPFKSLQSAHLALRFSSLIFGLLSVVGPSTMRAQATAPVASFGSVNLGSSETATVTFSFSSATTVSSVSVVTQGVTGLDFRAATSQAANGSCAAGVYAKSATCTYAATFSPLAVGPHGGAVVLLGSGGAKLAVGYLSGIGMGGQLILTASVPTAGPGSDTAYSIALDGAGDVFEGPNTSASFNEFKTDGTSVTIPITTGFTAGDLSYGLAIDGAGRVYISDAINGNILRVDPVTQTTTVLINEPFPTALAVDTSGNLYIGTGGNGLFEIAAGTSSATEISTIQTPVYGMTVDAGRNLYLVDFTGSIVQKLASGSSTPTTVATVSGVSGVAVDPEGNLFLNDGSILEVPAGASSAVSVASGANTFGALAIDSLGNLYASNSGTSQAGAYTLYTRDAQNVTLPTGTTTAVGAKSSPQSVTLQNNGNAAAQISSISGTGAADASGYSCSTSASVAAGSSCNVGLEFAPTSHGSPQTNPLVVSGNFVSPTLTITGYVTGDAYQLAFSTPPPVSLQTGQNAGSVKLALQDNSGGATTSTASVTLTVAGPNAYRATYTSAAVNGTATFNLGGTPLTTAGSYTYQATSSGLISASATETVYPYQLSISGLSSSPTASNSTNSATVSVLDNSGNATTQVDAVTLIVTGPNSYSQTYGPTNTSAANGSVTFTTAAITVAGTYTYTASSSGLTGSAFTQTVAAASPASLTLVAANSTAFVGYPDSITVTAHDAYGNATPYPEALKLTSTDPTATLPANFNINGSGSRPVTFNTANSSGWTVTATDLNNSSINGSTSIVVRPIPVFTINSSAGDTSGTCTDQALTGSAIGETTDSACTVYAAFAAVTALNNTATTSYTPTIDFATSLYGSTVTMTTAVTVKGNFILAGPGAGANAVTLSGGNSVRFLTQSSNSNMTLSGLTFSGFKGTEGAVLTGGGTPGLVTFSNDVFSNNAATQGGVFYGSNVVATGSAFNGNTAANGGVFYVTAGTVTLSSNTYTSNTATNLGGVVLSNASVSDSNCTYTSNSSSMSGGAIYAGGALSLTNCTFNKNHASTTGGAVYVSGALTMTAGSTSFTGNYAGNGNPAEGGALYSGGAATISGVSFINNYARCSSMTAYGGAAYLTGAVVTNTLLSGNYADCNTASAGGAVYGSGTFTGVTFVGNQAKGISTSAGSGGALYTTATTTLYNVTITQNSSKSEGGVFNGSGTLAAYNSVISGNTASSSFKDEQAVTVSGTNYIDESPASTCSTNCVPMLSALGNYGGITQTVVPLPGSPLLAAGSSSNLNGATTDGRGTGYPRSVSYNGVAHYDLGAVTANYTMAFAQEPVSTTTGTTLNPAPSVQIYESGNAFDATGGTLAISASEGAPSATSIAITGNPAPISLSFPQPETGETLIAAIDSGTSPYAMIATATSGAFNITNPNASLAFGTPPPSQVATGGNAGTVTVNLVTAAGSVYATGTDMIMLTVSGPAAGYPKTYTAAAVGGVSSFSLSGAALGTAGTYTYTATDISSTPYTTDTVQATEIVAANTVDHFYVTGIPSTAAPGTAYTFTVTAISAGGATDTAFAGPVVLTSSDAAASFVPPSYTYAASDAGVHTFTVMFGTSGVQSVTATDNTGQSGFETGILVYVTSVWVVNSNGTLSKLNGQGGAVVADAGTAGAVSSAGSLAFDSSGLVWSVTKNNNALDFLTNTGTSPATYTNLGVQSSSALAIDGNSNIWLANGNGQVVEVSNVGAAVSTIAGSTTTAGSGVAIDISGNVWVANPTTNTVDEVIGGAAPAAPLSTAVTNASTGTRP